MNFLFSIFSVKQTFCSVNPNLFPLRIVLNCLSHFFYQFLGFFKVKLYNFFIFPMENRKPYSCPFDFHIYFSLKIVCHTLFPLHGIEFMLQYRNITFALLQSLLHYFSFFSYYLSIIRTIFIRTIFIRTIFIRTIFIRTIFI
ncbi:predicted protein [Methanosarcina acetivorans C2A]|uniref:Uncharacterized protein n=1 Tax=Methanosarcina acetivorans (strain ATCC 35395 / DSM 2834 / JCM 12185 / C2A) TaxID=188937 RepID=Q8TRK6_METAC|nr:predicted protein [Methanosarcina acetivorans C2A]